MSYDVITVGGGLAGSALAITLARRGVRVLVLEKEKQFRDRVRGEGMLPWGVNEARALGIYDELESSCGHVVRYWDSRGWRAPRDLEATTPGRAHCLTFYHPDMQEILLGAAEDAGAQVRRGVSVKSVEGGQVPKVRVENGASVETLDAMLVVGADGRGSKVRDWIGLERHRDPERLITAGLLIEGSTMPDDAVHLFRKSSVGEEALFFPLGGGRVRCYFFYRKRGERRRLSGPAQVPCFLEACRGVDVPPEWLDGVSPAGPLAEFDGADTWVVHPYKDRVALVGDAASANDPTWGNGLSLTLRDVRALSERLLSDEDWDRAGHAYGEAHDEHFGAVRKVTRWLAEMLFEVGPEADARRERAFPLLSQDKSRSPDFIALGPETPHGERERRRFFAEE